MTITITAPLATPANIVTTPQAGGSLAASTRYYYRILAQNATNIGFTPEPSAQRSVGRAVFRHRLHQ